MNAKNHYWEFNTKENTYELYYTRFFKRELIATIKNNALSQEPILSGDYECVFGRMLNFNCIDLKSTSIEEAKNEAEALIVCGLNKKNEILHYGIQVNEMVIEDFKGEKMNSKQVKELGQIQ